MTGNKEFPYTFSLGTNHGIIGVRDFPGALRNIVGLHHGIIGMQVGEQRRLTIPSYLAFGEEFVEGVPARETLTLEVELIDVR